MKLPHIIALALCCATMVIASSCNKPKKVSSKITTEIPASVITSIEAHDAIVVKYTQAKGDAKVTVVCKKDYAQSYDIRVEGTKLIAATKPGAPIPTSGVEIDVTAPLLEEITAQNAAVVNLGKEASFDNNLKISVSRASCVKCKKLECGNLTLSATEASQIQLPRLDCNDITASSTRCAAIYLDGKAHDVKLKVGTQSTISTAKLEAHISVTTIDETNLIKPKQKPAAPKPAPKAEPDSTKKAS